MRRFRAWFAIFSIALIAPIVLLVQRSLQSSAAERQLRQQTVAERIFDEMERSLSDLLQAEENRPVDDYKTQAADRDPPFVAGRFEINAAYSSATAKRAPRRAAVDEDLAGPQADDLGAAIAQYFRAAPATTRKKEAGREQAPGTTVRLDRAPTRAALDLEEAGADAGADRRQKVSEYEALRSLNKAVEERLYARSEPKHEQRPEAQRGGASDEIAAVPSASLPVLDLNDAAFGKARMTGRAVSPTRMILYRTVARNSALLHQGVLIDVDQLGSWLRQRSIGGLQYASVDFATEGQTVAQPDDLDVPLYRHRFAPPFAALSARLRLRPLAFADSRNYLQLLSVALVAATLIGLVLFYRMVSVTLRFAERRGNFVAAVTHELRTPLTAIRMYGEMLRDGVVPSEAKRSEYYRHITNESERLSRLINNVLEYSRLEKGNRQVQLVSGSIVPVLTQVAEMMGPHAAERGYELILDVEPDLPAAQFEADALTQVLWNLVDNAIKYARGATDRRIVLGARCDGDRLLLSVRDYGPGVERHHLAEIFEPFYRGENELTRTAKGTGLGLALVRGLLERMGATVKARNAGGAGFIVEIRLQVPGGAG